MLSELGHGSRKSRRRRNVGPPALTSAVATGQPKDLQHLCAIPARALWPTACKHYELHMRSSYKLQEFLYHPLKPRTILSVATSYL
jgi:hypothetical protein